MKILPGNGLVHVPQGAAGAPAKPAAYGASGAHADEAAPRGAVTQADGVEKPRPDRTMPRGSLVDIRA